MENETLEEMMARGVILDIGIVEILPEEPEIDIPVYIGDERVCNGEAPALVVYRDFSLEPTAEEPAAPAEMSMKSTSKHSITANNAQERLKSLPELIGFDEPGIGTRVANAFGVITERQKMQAFGDYLAELIGRTPCSYIDPAGFVALANIAAINLQKGFERGTGKPVRESVRKVLSGKEPVFYDDLLSRIPQIAKAVAAAGFALEVVGIYKDAWARGKHPFQYALSLQNGQELNRMAAASRYGIFR